MSIKTENGLTGKSKIFSYRKNDDDHAGKQKRYMRSAITIKNVFATK